MKSKYDCIVVGGGPAGSTTAAITAEGGIDTLLLEREKVPRFHVGESLMPETYWTLERLGVLPKMRDSEFVKKVSVAFVTDSGKQSQPFFFKQHDPRECSQTWQVERADFDKMLWDNAADKGAECCDKTRVVDFLFDDTKRLMGVEVGTADGNRHKIASQVVVDATGQQAMLANRLRLKQDDPQLKKAAIWSYFQGATRDEGEHGGATIILHTEGKKTWFWFIPLSNDTTSIGVVGDHQYLLKRDAKPEEIFQEELAKCSVLMERLAMAESVDEYRVAKEFSYHTTQQAGDGWYWLVMRMALSIRSIRLAFILR